MRSVTVRVPATSANLGPGYDCLGLALGLHNTVTLALAPTPGVRIEGEGAGSLPRDATTSTSAPSSTSVSATAKPVMPSPSTATRSPDQSERQLVNSASGVLSVRTIRDRRRLPRPPRTVPR